MKAPRLKFTFVAVVVLGSVAAPVWVQHHGKARLNQQSEILAEQTARWTQLAAENQRLSNLVSQLNTQACSGPELTELLRLRGQVGSLRKTAAEVEQLRTKLNPQH